MSNLADLYGGQLKQGIEQSAAALGMSPTDLATIISYETAGTFNPSKRGPVTQHGQHQGLIQFGEPQARQYGVDWGNPLGSQLGPDGAVVRYFRDNGYQPGMGLLDAYSIVNAGAPGRYNASDANNGGAPGSVLDKVRDQMAGHRTKAMSLFGGSPAPGFAAPAGAPDTPQKGLAEALEAVSPTVRKRPTPANGAEEQHKALADLIRF